jgi:hypothetical protein
MGWFDAFKGYAFQGSGVKIVASADGKRVWAEKEGEFPVLSATERALLVDAARDVGATLTDPTGVFANSVRFEARIESGCNETHYRVSEFGSAEYRQRSYREIQQCIDDKVREELAKIGK